MAKLKAPLLSFGASGAIAKTHVHFNWKGLNVAREYVIPTNPKSDAQVTQRGHVTEAVDKIHVALADGTNPIDSEDKSAFSLWASALGIVMTWFNMIVKYWVDQRVAGGNGSIISNMHCTPGIDKLTVQGFVTASVGGDPVTGKLYYGLSKTSLINSIVCTIADLATGKDITGLTTGVKYYVQYRPTTAGYTLCYSGIYHGVPL